MKTTFFKTCLVAFATGLILTCCSTEEKPFYGQRTDALDDSAWDTSCWISVVDAPVVTGVVRDGVRAADGANWFVSKVKNEGKVVSAKWMTTGLGVYDLFVNGKLIGEEVLKPGFTHFEKTKISFTYDVTEAFRTGKGAENVLSAQVTPGWWADKIVTHSGHQGMVGKKCAFRGVLELTFKDGSKKLYGTGTQDWTAGIAGPVKHAAIFDGETYDARELQGYEVADKFSAPEENTEFNGRIYPSAGAEIYYREDLTLKPVRAYVWKDIEGASDDAYGKVVISKEFAPGETMTVHPGENLVVDFGQNCSAVPSFVFNAKEGTTLTCLPSELLNDGNGAKSRGMDGPEGSIHRLNLRIPKTGMILEYTFADSKSDVSFRPRSTFFGYRLVSITATDDVTIKSIESVPVTSIAKNMDAGKITTGNELVNKLISNTWWGQLSNYLSVSTDCPQRNERLGWMADTQVFTEAGSFFANTSSFFHKWLRDVRDTQSKLGGYPGVAPLAQYGADDNNMMRVGWADAGVIVPWTIWKQFGDKGIVDESWDSMEKFMNHVNETKYDHTALAAENGNYQWADWLSYEPLESCEGRAFDRDKKGNRVPKPDAIAYWNYLNASYWAIDAAMMRDMAKAAGKDVAKYEAMVSAAKAYIKEKFLTRNGEFKTAILNTMQTPALFALKNELVEGQAKENMVARLRKNFADHGNCLQTGFLGTSILMGVLTDNGMSDIAYELLFQRKNPSWLYSVDNGATTIWERWNSYMIDKGMGPKGMNSFNHYAYGAVCAWIWETAAGIAADTSAPGFKHIIMKPVPDARLGHLDAEYKSAAGVIKSSWKFEGNKWIWNFTIPEGATASVTLPGETKAEEFTAGTYEKVVEKK
ncbi:MAG: family 78 glycoside hydrolase catalytic domain [Bacteroidales bacterium]|nr:family 78 glycoside hydrolase catalytic domain [Bacteroidales bacterium]